MTLWLQISDPDPEYTLPLIRIMAEVRGIPYVRRCDQHVIEGTLMYLDTVVVSGVVVVILTTVILVYVGRYMMRHMRQDKNQAENEK